MADNFNILDHGGRPALYVISGNNLTDTNTTAAEREFMGLTIRRISADLTGRSQARLVITVGTAGVSGTQFGIQYSVDSGSNWFFLTGVASGGSPGTGDTVTIDAQGVRTGAWATLAAAARTDVLLRPVTRNGDGATDPNVTHIALEVR